jgi:hypothetical protein
MTIRHKFDRLASRAAALKPPDMESPALYLAALLHYASDDDLEALVSECDSGDGQDVPAGALAILERLERTRAARL